MSRARNLADLLNSSGKIKSSKMDSNSTANGSIDSQHLATASVDLAHISSQSVDEDNLYVSNAGTNGQYLQKQSGNSGGLTWDTVDLTTLSATNLTSGIVPTARINAGSIANDLLDSQHYAAGSIDTEHLAADSVTTAKIADSVALGGSPTTTTQTAADNSTKIATTAYADAAIAALADSAPATLNTLNELAAALGDDANYSATITTALGTKMPLAGGAFTGAVTTNSTIDGRDVAADGVLATNAMPKSGGAFTGAVTTNSTIDGRDVAADGVLATNALPKSGGAMTGAITTNSTFDGRNVSVDGTKLDGIAASANNYSLPASVIHQTELSSSVSSTSTTVAANSAAVKAAYDRSWPNTTYSVGDGGLSQINFTSADHTKLNGIETSATADQTAAQIKAHLVNGIDSTHYVDGSIDNEHIADNAINSEHYADGSIDRAHLAADVIDSTKLADDSVNSEHYVNGSIDAVHIASNSITATQLAADCVGASELADNSVGAANIIANSITAGDIAAGAVGASEIGNDVVNSQHYAAGSIDNEHIANDAINSEHYAAGSIDAEHIASRAVTGTKIALDLRTGASTHDVYWGNSHDYILGDASHGLRFYTSGSEEMRLEDDGDLHVDGNITAYSTTVSDERLKTDITTLENALDKIKQIRGVEFTRIKDGKRSAGIIAQELEVVLPQAITEKALPYEADTETVYKTVDYDQIHGLLIQCIKEQQVQIETLMDMVGE